MENLDIHLGSDVMLGQQLYGELRRLILSRKLKPGKRLPPSRALADMLKISRSTVTETYEQLLTEGYLESRGRHGTFVSPDIPKVQPPPARTTKIASASGKIAARAKLTTYAQYVASSAAFERETRDFTAAFFPWRPAFDEFPQEEWARTVGRFARKYEHALLDYPIDPLGSIVLREAIAGYLERSRHIRCQPDQIIIVDGFQQALDLVFRVYVRPGDQVIVENPGYAWIRHAAEANQAKIVPVTVDDQGLETARLAQFLESGIKLACVSPSHQYPTGALLPLPRRLELLEWARQSGTIIVEDEHDSEFRYDGHTIPALKSLDDHDNVIHIGTFARVLFPGLSAGYMIVPEHVSSLFGRVKRLSSEQLPSFLQCALADFIEQGSLERHIWRMQEVYAKRREALLRSLKRFFGKRATIFGEEAGLHVMVRFETRLSAKEILEKANKEGIGLIATEDCYLSRPQKAEFILGYGGLTEPDIREGIRRLAEIIK
jgi:GntR family transcriptional regulator / MocR family aminotransferase